MTEVENVMATAHTLDLYEPRWTDLSWPKLTLIRRCLYGRQACITSGTVENHSSIGYSQHCGHSESTIESKAKAITTFKSLI